MKFEFEVEDETSIGSTQGWGCARAPDAGPSSEPRTLFTAIEQLGSKLQSDRGPDEVLVIERAEKPVQ